MNMRSVAVAAIGVSMLVSTPAVAQLGGVGTSITGTAGGPNPSGAGDRTHVHRRPPGFP